MKARDEICLPTVHVVEDNDGLRDSTVRGYGYRKTPAIGYATGEAFLDRWHPDIRGVVRLDINLSLHGGMNGEKVLERLIDLRCHMPVVFYTDLGYGTPRPLDLVTARANIKYFAKGKQALQHAEAQIEQFLETEPGLYAQAKRARGLLQELTMALTHRQRVSIDGVLTGLQRKELAREIKANPAVLDLQAQEGFRRLTGFDRFSGPNMKAVMLAKQAAPLFEQMGIANDSSEPLVQLAAKELILRFRLLDEAQQVALHQALRSPRPAPNDIRVLQALRMMSIADVAHLRSVLKTAGKKMFDVVEAGLVDPQYRWVRHWLTWVRCRPSETAWCELTDPGGD